jgi:glycosyltransferase involved in cell wall biosynthesis
MAVSAVFVAPYRFLPPRNGGQQAAWGFARWLAQYAQLDVVSTPGNTPPADLPFALQPLLESSPIRYISPRAGWRLWRLLRRRQAQWLIVQQPFFALMARWVARLHGAALVVYSHNLEYLRFRSMGKWWWPLVYLVEGWAYRRADYVLFISPDELAPGIRAFGLAPHRCRVLPYGVDQQTSPPRQAATATIRQRHGLHPQAPVWLLFGPLGYAPNLEALDRVLAEVAPHRAAMGFPQAAILVCGGGLPERYQGLEAYRSEGVQYLGFVPDIDDYLLGADVLLNPVESGAGVKTKVIEAIARGLPVASTHNGALGLDREACGPMLRIAPDGDYAAFRLQLAELQRRRPAQTPAAFYQRYYWPNCLQPLLEIMNLAPASAQDKINGI